MVKADSFDYFPLDNSLLFHSYWCVIQSRVNHMKLKSSKGAALVEYVVLFAILSIGLIAVLITLGDLTKDPFDDTTTTIELIEIPDAPDQPLVVVPAGGTPGAPTGTIAGPGGGPGSGFVYTGCNPPGATWNASTQTYLFDIPVFAHDSNPNHRDRLVPYPFDRPLRVSLPTTRTLDVYTTIRRWNTTDTAAWFEFGYEIQPGGVFAPGSPECAAE